MNDIGPRYRHSGPSTPLVVGLVLMAGAFGLDLAAHAAVLASVEPTAHAAGMLGMVITWSAVVFDGLRHAARPV